MAKPLFPEDLWSVIEPLLPPPRPRPKGGRPPLSNRAALTGILFVLETGSPWEYLPVEMGRGSGMSCRRRLRDWQEAGVWAALHGVLLEWLHGAGQIDWSRAALDSASVPAERGVKRPARTRPIAASPVALRRHHSVGPPAAVARSATSSRTHGERRSA